MSTTQILYCCCVWRKLTAFIKQCFSDEGVGNIKSIELQFFHSLTETTVKLEVLVLPSGAQTCAAKAEAENQQQSKLIFHLSRDTPPAHAFPRVFSVRALRTLDLCPPILLLSLQQCFLSAVLSLVPAIGCVSRFSIASLNKSLQIPFMKPHVSMQQHLPEGRSPHAALCRSDHSLRRDMAAHE